MAQQRQLLVQDTAQSTMPHLFSVSNIAHGPMPSVASFASPSAKTLSAASSAFEAARSDPGAAQIGFASLPMTQPTRSSIPEGADARTQIHAYVQELVANELPSESDRLEHQRARFCPNDPERLKAPLPTYTADGELNFFPQLLLRNTAFKTIDTAVKGILRCDSAQAPKMMIAVASSGMGKTHLGYEAGMKLTYCIMIRVGLFGCGAKDFQFSAPWRLLFDQMEVYQTQDIANIPGEQREEIDKCCSRLMEVLALCYIHVTADALTFAMQQHNVTKVHKLMELCVRFHRNGRSEAIIAKKYQEICEAHGTIKEYRGEPTCTFDRKFVRSFGEDAKCRMQALPQLTPSLSAILCFDEVGALLKQAKDIFLSTRAVYQDGAPIDPKFSRGAFYGLVSVASGIYQLFAQEERGIGRCISYMTGTSFSMVTESDGFSGARRIAQGVFPSELLDLSKMQEIISSYFNIPDEILRSPELEALLTKCSGRPLFFMECVMMSFVRSLGSSSETIEHGDRGCCLGLEC